MRMIGSFSLHGITKVEVSREHEHDGHRWKTVRFHDDRGKWIEVVAYGAAVVVTDVEPEFS